MEHFEIKKEYFLGIKQLIAYSNEHFSYETALMEAYHYPDEAAHMRQLELVDRSHPDH